MKRRTRFAILALITLGCATGEQTDDGNVALGSSGSAGANASAGTGGTATNGGTASVAAGTGGSGGAGTSLDTAGTFSNAGTFATAGSGGASAGGAAASGGVSGSGGTSAGAAGKAAGGAGGKATGGSGGTATAGSGGTATAGSGGSGPVTAYCDDQTKSPLPYTVNGGFQPSGWQGDVAAISGATVAPDPCAARAAGSVGLCTAWRYTPSAVTPAWAGVSWTRNWDADYVHPPVCVAAGATRVTFQARGANGGEQVTFSAAGAGEVPFTLTNAWKEYHISLVGVQYNTTASGVASGFFWKVAPPTPNGAPVTFFVDDIQFVQ